MREASQSKRMTVPAPIDNDNRICHTGGVCETMRTSIVIGEKNGNIETQKANDELGLRSTGEAISKLATNKNTTGIAIWPPS